MLFNSILPEASVTPRRISSIQMIAFGSVTIVMELETGRELTEERR
jgi:hypothetical protein